MGDILGNAVSGLLSFQRALTTTSHNIANVNTPGYSRQRVELDTQNPSLIGGRYVGNGVQIESIQRSYDQFLNDSLRQSTSSFSQLDRFHQLASQIDDIVADPQGGVSPMLQDFFTAVQDVADDPTSATTRFQLLSSGESLANRFASVDIRLDQLARNTEADLRNSIDDINRLAADLAQVNRTLEDTNPSGVLSQQSSDLLDQRDALLQELSQLVGMQVIGEPNNLITVTIGNGQTIVGGADAFSLSVTSNPSNPTQSIIVYDGLNTISDISAQLQGGELGGLLDYRDNVLQTTINSMGRIASGLALTFNSQHRSGLDLNNELGADFFAVDGPQSIPYSSNSGSAVVTTSITDVSQLTIDDYNLRYNGVNWDILSTSGATGSINSGDTFEGLTFAISGAAAVGDQFTIKPTAAAAGSISLVFDDANRVAAAAPLRSIAPASNLGDIEISQPAVTDASLLPAPFNSTTFPPVSLTFISPTQFTASVAVDTGSGPVVAGTPINFSNGMTLSANGWQTTLNGTAAQAGDQLTIAGNFGGAGDNRNVLGLANLQTTAFFENGASNYQDAYNVIVGRVGSLTRSAEVGRDSQQSLLVQAQDRRDQVSAVNLDEEAADMIKYQQAYEAAARVIATAQVLFETLISATR